jgi:hypothetical protein
MADNSATVSSRQFPADILSSAGRARAPGFRLLSLFWLAILILHLIAAGLWWWLQPGGFPFSHPRFWINRVAPVLVFAWSVVSLQALHREQFARFVRWLPAWPALWAGLALGGRLTFPVSLDRLWIAPLAGALVMGLTVFTLGRRAPPRQFAWGLVAAVCWFLAGVGCVVAQRPPEPSASPLLGNVELLADAPGSSETLRPTTMSWNSGASVQGNDASVSVRCKPLTIFVNPLLRFLSQGPDGCWTVFVPAELRDGAEPRMISARQISTNSMRWSYQIPGQGSARLLLEHDADQLRTLIEATARLERPMFSHLNSFCDIEVRGHSRLFLGFSPCPEVKVEVLRFDYPVGRPARFAFVDAARRFRVVEASSGEKGPFRTLAEGRLERTDPLVITLHDQDRPVAQMTLFDWSAQAGTELSPTGGWGVPVNAIEFSLNSEGPASPASIFVTLAATSVGRGWDCVGHPAGTYRNRVMIEPADSLVGSENLK